ncbi:hypothetical protein ACKKBF_B38435 [Auxenochlorella protothecoides x Auxenochlorella symbiontica]
MLMTSNGRSLTHRVEMQRKRLRGMVRVAARHASMHPTGPHALPLRALSSTVSELASGITVPKAVLEAWSLIAHRAQKAMQQVWGLAQHPQALQLFSSTHRAAQQAACAAARVLQEVSDLLAHSLSALGRLVQPARLRQWLAVPRETFKALQASLNRLAADLARKIKHVQAEWRDALLGSPGQQSDAEESKGATLGGPRRGGRMHGPSDRRPRHRRRHRGALQRNYVAAAPERAKESATGTKGPIPWTGAAAVAGRVRGSWTAVSQALPRLPAPVVPTPAICLGAALLCAASLALARSRAARRRSAAARAAAAAASAAASRPDLRALSNRLSRVLSPVQAAASTDATVFQAVSRKGRVLAAGADTDAAQGACAEANGAAPGPAGEMQPASPPTDRLATVSDVPLNPFTPGAGGNFAQGDAVEESNPFLTSIADLDGLRADIRRSSSPIPGVLEEMEMDEHARKTWERFLKQTKSQVQQSKWWDPSMKQEALPQNWIDFSAGDEQ